MNAQITRQQRVMRLYRQALKTCLSWAVRRDLFYVEAESIRARIEQNKAVRDKAAIDRLIKKGEEELRSREHPDPYIVPYYLGGSLYARNPPFPAGIPDFLRKFLNAKAEAPSLTAASPTIRFRTRKYSLRTNAAVAQILTSAEHKQRTILSV